METKEKIKQIVTELPHTPGIYMYRDVLGTILYVGKAKDLKKRVSQYFKPDLLDAKTIMLVSQIADIQTIATASEFDALLLEAKLIHDHKPKYNIILKDDKSPLYILLTISEPLPRILLKRQRDLPEKIKKDDVLFGPFQSARIVRSLIRGLRRVTPYCTQKIRNGRPCFYTHIGLCHPCPSVIAKLAGTDEKKSLTQIYRRNIFRLRDILSGKSTTVLHDMEHEMKLLAKEQKFEDAAAVRNQVEHLHTILKRSYDPSLYVASDTAVSDIFEREEEELRALLTPYIPEIHKIHRIECMDISNTQGKNAVGSMVVLTDGQKDTSEYKRFRIRMENSPNDFAMMAEVVTRRFSHPEWPTPDLLVIDGGKGQVTAAQNALGSSSTAIPVIGLAKRFEEIIVPVTDGWKVIRVPPTAHAIHLLQRIRDEAHRFAITYHKLLRKKSFVKNV